MFSDKSIIEIVYLCIGTYSNYANGFLGSIHKFFPNNKKFIRIITDSNDDFVNNGDSNILYTEIIKKEALIYPCVNLHKIHWIYSIPKTKCDYTFYFDADTIIIDNNINWNLLGNSMDDDSIIVCSHPHDRVNDINFLDYWHNVSIPYLTENDESKQAYIGTFNYRYIISSFFGAKTDILHGFCKHIDSMIDKDLSKANNYHIPMIFDENYVNKLVFEYDNGISDMFKFKVGRFNTINGYDIEYCDEVFMVQKNLGEKIEKK